MEESNHNRRNERFDKKEQEKKWKKDEMSEWWWVFSLIAVTFSYFIELSHRDEQFVYVIAARHMYLKCECIFDLVWALRQQHFVPLTDQNQQQSIYRHVTFVHSQCDLCKYCFMCTMCAFPWFHFGQKQKYEQFCDRENGWWTRNSRDVILAITNFTKMPIIARCSSSFFFDRINAWFIILICPAWTSREFLRFTWELSSATIQTPGLISMIKYFFLQKLFSQNVGRLCFWTVIYSILKPKMIVTWNIYPNWSFNYDELFIRFQMVIKFDIRYNDFID